MATPVRVTGMVLNSVHRSGTAKASGNPYSFATVTILVGVRGTVDVVVQADAGVRLGDGEVVDLVADLTVYGGRAQLAYLAQWTVADTAGLAAA